MQVDVCFKDMTGRLVCDTQSWGKESIKMRLNSFETISHLEMALPAAGCFE